MNTRVPSDFHTDDLFLFRALSTVCSGSEQQWLVFPVKRAVRDDDGYETTLWGLRPDVDGKARQLTEAAFGASHPQLGPDGSRLAFLSERDEAGMQVHVLPMDDGEAQPLTHEQRARLETLEGWSRDGSRLLATASVDHVEDGEEKNGSAGRPPQVATHAPYKEDGSGHTIGKRTHLFAIDANTGEAKALTNGDFDVTTGAVLDGPTTGPLAVYPVREADGQIEIGV